MLVVDDISVSFKGRRALENVSLSLPDGGGLAIVGESGSGKSTLARVICGLVKPDSGKVRGNSSVQMIFQDAVDALDPRQSVQSALEEAGGNARELLRAVELGEEVLTKKPAKLSGGQCQRVCIARALARNPRVLIADEPVSALDVSVQARILKLLRELRKSRGIALLLITHDLAIVPGLCENVIVMRQGHIVEAAETAQLFAAPQDPYTRRLFAAVPRF